MRKIVPEIASDEVRPIPEPKARPKPRQPVARKGPGPSKLSYRLSRAWAKPALRNALLVYLPLTVLAVTGWRIAAHDGLRETIEAKIITLVEQVAARPEFAVRGVSVSGVGEDLRSEVRRTLDIRPGMSSLKLDVEELRHGVEDLGAVRTATVQFDPQGTLRVAVVERIAAALLRRDDKVLVLLDINGVEIGPAGSRATYHELPVVLGAGARDHIGEVIDLLEAASDIVPRLRAFVRVSERRWDVVLDRGMTIKLPADGSIEAMSRIMALHYGEELLDRDIAVIDMRIPGRPALRMNLEAAETYQIRKAVTAIGGEDT